MRRRPLNNEVTHCQNSKVFVSGSRIFLVLFTQLYSKDTLSRFKKVQQNVAAVHFVSFIEVGGPNSLKLNKEIRALPFYHNKKIIRYLTREDRAGEKNSQKAAKTCAERRNRQFCTFGHYKFRLEIKRFRKFTISDIETIFRHPDF